jgi:hypothetical protein
MILSECHESPAVLIGNGFGVERKTGTSRERRNHLGELSLPNPNNLLRSILAAWLPSKLSFRSPCLNFGRVSTNIGVCLAPAILSPWGVCIVPGKHLIRSVLPAVAFSLSKPSSHCIRVWKSSLRRIRFFCDSCSEFARKQPLLCGS